MMIYLLLRHTVEDYGRWKEGFDKHLAARQAGGATNEVYVMRNVDDAQEIIVLLGWHDLVSVRAFTNSVSLQTALKQMGVVGVAEVRFLKEVG
jgi:heme-degrading monooxygenase HmoA